MHAQSSALILGGHTFIEQLGSDPAAGEALQREIVEACLDGGITWFDTTYQPERVALGRALASLGRRDEATIIAWNFFVDFAPGEDCGPPAAYEPHHLELMCEQLQTDHIDRLVVHGVEDPAAQARQEQLAMSWKQGGRVGALGLWAPPEDIEARLGPDNPYDFMVCPYNVTNTWSAPRFAAARRLDWQTLACSPFVRGWDFEKLLAGGGQTDTPGFRERLADAMLRFSLFGENVDRLIVAMRRPEWVAANLASVARGPLNEQEQAWLLGLAKACLSA